MIKHSVLLLFAWLCAGVCGHAYDIPGFTPDQIIPFKQTQNSTGDPVVLNLDVFTPDGHQASDSRPAIVFFFGGGWSSGSTSHFHPHCEYLASRGMVAISAEYRVSSLHGTTPQECVRDGKSALRYVRENAAALGIDPNRIVASGGSSGGHIAAAAGTLTSYEEAGENLAVSSRPNALVLFNPVFDNGPTGYGYSRVQAYWEDISPLHNIDATAPPTVVFLGTNDSLIPVATAENYKALMEAAGRRCDLHLYEGQPHSFFNFDVPDDGSGPFYGYRSTVFRMDEFLVSLGYVTDPHAAPVAASGWVTIAGDAGFSGGSAAGASPLTTDADGDIIAAGFSPVDLADGEFVRLSGSVTLDVPLTGSNFKIGLFNGDDPVAAGDGTGYVGIWAEAPDTSASTIKAGDGTGSHPFEATVVTSLGPLPAAETTVPANTPIEFSLFIARNGSDLEISTNFSDSGSYNPSQNLLKQAVANYRYDRVSFHMGDSLDGSQASFSNIEVARGAVLPGLTTTTGGTAGPITYIDAVEGVNTFASGGSPADTSWENGTNGSDADEDQWTKRTLVGGNGDSLFQAMHSLSPDEMPELTTRITGLSAGTYEIWAFYWDQVVSGTQNWTISAGLTSGALGSYSSPGQPPVPGAVTDSVSDAGTLNFTTSPEVIINSGLTTERRMYGVNLGRVTVTAGGVVEVYVDNLIGNGSANRTWFDGVGYAPVSAGESLSPDPANRLFGIDFNRNDALASPSQSRFRIVAGSSIPGENATSYAKSVGSHQVIVSKPDASAFEFRGGNGDGSREIPGGDTSLSFLVADFIATRAGVIDLSVSNLPAGDYIFRSYHLETFNSSALGFAQGAGTTTPNTIEARMDGLLKGSVQPTALGSVGLNTTFINDSQIPTLTFGFSHDGEGPLEIQLTATESNGANSFLFLNGFELFTAGN